MWVADARVGVVAIGAAGPFGFEWQGLARAARSGGGGPDWIRPAAAPELPGVERCVRVPDIPEQRDIGDRRIRRLMSRAARLTAIAARAALRDAGWDDPADRERVGYFAGVGASDPRPDDMLAVLRASVEDGELSMARMGQHGLRAFHPLRTFMLLPNFTMCHSAILERTGGPNGTYFSRGAGTVTALREAVWALADRRCDRALAGAGDTALHPFTWSELSRAGFAALVPGEGAGILALVRQPKTGLAWIEHCEVAAGRERGLAAALARACEGIPAPDLVVLAPWGPPAREALREFAAGLDADAIDATEVLGDALAATPALAWALAIDWLHTTEAARRALVVTAGVDGDAGAVVFARPHTSRGEEAAT